MAEEAGQSRTEAPTQRRRDEARRQGRVAVSPDLTAAVLLLAGVLALLGGAAALGSGLLNDVRKGLAARPPRELTVRGAADLLTALMVRGGGRIGPLVALLFAAALAVMAFQVGLHLVPELLALKPERLAQGLGRLFSLGGVVRGLVALLRVAIIAAAAYLVCAGRRRELATLGQHDLATASSLAWGIVLRVALVAAVILVVLGVLDYGAKRFQLEQSLRMSRRELIEEHRQEEGDPQIKARIRKLGREYSQRRMMQEVPRATVVVTNPTHLAIALRYDRAVSPAPRVVAKGAGLIARRIVEAARRHAVPVVERRPVAQALFRAVKVGQDIPLALYQAVAEVLAFVYRLRDGSQAVPPGGS